MELLKMADAAHQAGVSVTTLRNYLRDKRITAYERGNRLFVDRSELMAVFGLKRLTRSSPEGTRVIAVANQKGGVGKTTTAVALAAILAREAPVLAIDGDPQGNMTQAFGFDPDALERTLYDVLVDESPLADTCQRVGPPPPDLMLVPANLDLSDTWRRVAGRVGLEGLLKTMLQPCLARFSFVVIDCAPSLDMMTLNALVAATDVIVPVDMSIFSVRGMVKLMGTLQEVRKVNPNLPPPKILATRTKNTTVSQTIETELRERFGSTIFAVSVPDGKDVAAAHIAKSPLPFFAPKGKPALAYEAVVEEVLRG